jgi:hypothetical protein
LVELALAGIIARDQNHAINIDPQRPFNRLVNVHLEVACVAFPDNTPIITQRDFERIPT